MINPNILPSQKPIPVNRHRPNFITTTSTLMLTTSPYTHSKPKPPTTRTTFTKTNLYHNHNYSSAIYHHSILSDRTYNILHLIRSNSNPNPHPNYTLRKPTRTPKRWHLLNALHSNQLPPTANHNSLPTRTTRYSTPNNTSTYTPPHHKPLN